MDDPRYPVGRYAAPERVTPEQRREWIEVIAATPQRLREAIAGLNEAQLDTPYREGGWTVRQVVHHLPDSHCNAYVRHKLALTEAVPAIKTYDEAAWARLPDSRDTPVEVSLALLTALHQRWTGLLRALDETQWARTLRHPEHGEIPLDKNVGLYAWHCRHHLAHITTLRAQRGW
jgi:hypothetical protein